MGGVYERMIGLFKKFLKRTIGHLLPLDEFVTICAYAEAACNDRPLYYVSRQDTGTFPLTPNMLLYGRNLRQCNIDESEVDLNDPTYEFGQPGHLNRTCKHLKSKRIQFRKIWSHEYLSALRDRNQSRNKNSPSTKYMLVPSIGDIVVFSSNSMLRTGKILKLLPSADQEIRKVLVESEGHESIQAVANLRLLECGGSLDTKPFIATESDDTDDLESDQDNSPRRNQRRAAAAQAHQQWLSQVLITTE